MDFKIPCIIEKINSSLETQMLKKETHRKVFCLLCLSPFVFHQAFAESFEAEPTALHGSSELEISADSKKSRDVGISDEDKAVLFSMSEVINNELPEKLNFKIKFTRSNYFSARPNCESRKDVGTILIGPHKFHKFKNRPKVVLELLFAHEIAHILHFLESETLTNRLCQGSKLDIKDLELFADFIAGFILQRTKGVTSKELARASMIIISEHSDYQFSNIQDHHGTVGVIKSEVKLCSFFHLIIPIATPLSIATIEL